jgi:ABC-type nickel/cobalt efflux system permease component RcnA
MAKYWKIFSIAVVLMWFFLGFYLLLSPRFNNLTKEIRVIFAVFLFLYGGWRLARIFTKDREREDED